MSLWDEPEPPKIGGCNPACKGDFQKSTIGMADPLNVLGPFR